MALKLEQWIGKHNIIDAFTDDELNRLGAQVVQDWETDLASRADWEKGVADGLELAMQIADIKTWPWNKASNIKYPLIAFAAIQFHARAYPEVVPGNNVVKGKVIGRDEDGSKQDRADRIGKHMSYQLLEEMVEWEEDTDRLLMMLPIIGTLFKKTYFDPLRQRNVSCVRKPLSVVVHADAKSIDDARRITDQDIYLYRNDIHERVAQGLFVDEPINYEFDEEQQKPEHFLEQHRWYDLDGDGYEEPYVVTVHKMSQKVMRVYPRYDADSVIVSETGRLIKIDPIQYFTKFSFIPSFDGSFYDIGFAQLLRHLNEAINSLINQLIDAGTLSNVQGGLISRGIKIKGGQYQFRPGEWKQTDASPQELKDGFFPLPVKEPSAVLFTMLSFLVDAGKQLSSVADIMTGEQAGANEPVGTMLARIDQGMKVFNGIYKRVFRSLKSEYKKIAKLNRDYMDEEYYYRVLDIENVALRADYDAKDCDVVPVSDPTTGTDIQRLAKAQALMELQGAPGVDNWEVVDNYLHAIKVDNIEKIHPKQGKDQPPPADPKIIEAQAKIENMGAELEMKKEKQEAEIALIDAQIEATRAKGIRDLAEAEAVQLGPQLEYYKQFASQLSEENERLKMPELEKPEGAEMETEDDESGIPGMEESSGDGGSFSIPEGLSEGLDGEIPLEELGGGDIPGGGAPTGGLIGD